MPRLGRVGIIANPVAQSGAAAAAAKRFAGMICDHIAGSTCNLLLSKHPGHAIDLAQEARDAYDTLIVIGGDGIVHEAANGLMRVEENLRPRFAVVPVGSGNDYALTLGMSGNLEKAMKQIAECNTRKFDVGKVNDEYFVQTLSFGLDAAIALDTMERRKKSGRHGTILYMESGFDQIVNHRVPQKYHAELEGLPDFEDADVLNIQGESYIFAVQIGKTYGGHFKVCPDASPTDGLFDICIAHPPLSAVKALFIFMMAKAGKHTKFKMFEFHKASSLVVDFDAAPSCQADGEKIEGTHFEIETIPHALEVVVGDFRD